MEEKPMSILAVIFGILLLIAILQDSFETIILPRRVTRRFRLSRLSMQQRGRAGRGWGANCVPGLGAKST
jgi:hypothetical protein